MYYYAHKPIKTYHIHLWILRIWFGRHHYAKYTHICYGVALANEELLVKKKNWNICLELWIYVLNRFMAFGM